MHILAAGDSLEKGRRIIFRVSSVYVESSSANLREGRRKKVGRNEK